MWAEEKTATFDFKSNYSGITITTQGTSGGGSAAKVSVGEVQIDGTDAYAKENSSLLIYKNSSLTFKLEENTAAAAFYIKSITITYAKGCYPFSSKSGLTDIESSNLSKGKTTSAGLTATYTAATSAPYETSVVLENSNSGKVEVTKLVVTYEYVASTKTDPEISFATTSFIVKEGDDFDTQVPTSAAGYTGSYTYSTSNASVANVNATTGAVTIGTKGTAVITATTAADDESFQQKSTSYTITVKKLVAFNCIIYESFDKNDGTGGNDDVWSGISLTPDSDFDLTGWTIEKVYAASECVRTGSDGYLTSPALGVAGDVTLKFRMASWGNDTNSGYVDIIDGGTFDDGTSTQKTVSIKKSKWDSFELKLLGVTTGTKIKFSDGGNSKRLFIDEVEILLDKQPVTITTAEYATFVSSFATDFSTTGITAYTATDAETSVTLNEITSGKVPANTPVVLYKAGAGGTAINVPVIASADAPAGTNDLHVSTGTDVENMYVLSKKSGTVGFYKWAGTSALSAGKVYLQASSSSAPDFLGFDGGTTAVEGVKAVSVESGEYFNLAGQRVAQPTKGLYIVNGKKVVVK